MKWSYIESIVVIILLFFLLVLFVGEPDLHDPLIIHLKGNCEN